MDFLLTTGENFKTTFDCLVLGVSTKSSSKIAFQLDPILQEQINTFLKIEDFFIKSNNFFWMQPKEKKTAKQVLLVSINKNSQKKKALTDHDIEITYKKAIEIAVMQLKKTKAKTVMIPLESFLAPQHPLTWTLKQFIRTFYKHWYSFDQFKESKSPKPQLKKIHFIIDKKFQKDATQLIKEEKAIAQGCNLTKDLSNLPGNICTPDFLAKEAKALSKKHPNMSCTVLDEKQMKALGMNSLLAVSAGSALPAKLICMKYTNGKKNVAPVVFVGKGITFDSGGISIKPSEAMDEMKYDMCGSASVFGVMEAIIALDLSINVIGLIPAAENMPGSRATRPGDIVTSMSGKSIEILNTDAEGRLVLCDALTYAKRFKPKVIIDMATLTGACVVALGHENTGLFSNNKQLAKDLLKAAEESEDHAWQLPLGEAYSKLLHSSCADIANISGGRYAGSITAACFLEKFIEDTPWSHLDIAGTAWHSGKNKRATGRPVPLLVRYLLNMND